MATAANALDAKISRSPGKIGMIIFGIVLLIGFAYAGSHLLDDLRTMHSDSVLPFVLLGVALFVALGFEFVNGFHDTANAVATVIYTHSFAPWPEMKPTIRCSSQTDGNRRPRHSAYQLPRTVPRIPIDSGSVCCYLACGWISSVSIVMVISSPTTPGAPFTPKSLRLTLVEADAPMR